ncbi:cytochrome P450 [Mycena albidolilacea]|uniref:Cytochrome P450 n=1 Tax=Mycena albidolilacea TaxID=1033008 RepID=A0AAD6ZID4_9AGAR|nr:cytochrome P450 [Mycena albidolilacea]
MNSNALQWIEILHPERVLDHALDTSTAPFLLAGALLITTLAWRRFSRSHHAPLPPGPRGLPLIGNAHQLPLERQWLTFTDWAKSYGEIVHVSAFGQPVVILNSSKAVSDLLERRSTMYSDRPQFAFVGNLVGYADSVPLTPYGDRHREYRRLMSEVLGPRTVSQWRVLEEKHMREFLRDIVRTPEQFLHHIRRSLSPTVHGYTVAREEDPMMLLAQQADHEFATAVLPGRYLCDVFPLLRFVPDWLAGFKREAKRFRKTMERLQDEPYAMVKEQIAQGRAKPSFTSGLIERDANPSVDQELIYKWSVSAISSFFLAMGTHVDIQKKAQEELDRVVGRSRLPTFADQDKLPYVKAIISELHRWSPVGPLAVPHRCSQGDIYSGFCIPAGATVLANSWGILHDPALYPAPEDFIPERFLADERLPKSYLNPDPRRYAFGYGRRVCPGRDLADDILFLCVAMTLAVFDVRCDDATVVEYTSSIISHPMPFQCAITPRSREAELLVVQMGEEGCVE